MLRMGHFERLICSLDDSTFYLWQWLLNGNTKIIAECSYPRGEGDGFCPLHISQLCQGTSSGIFPLWLQGVEVNL